MPKQVRWVAVVVALLISVLLGWIADRHGGDPKDNPWLKALGMFWALAPPAWFFVDWWRYKGPNQGPDFEHFKLSQDRAKEIWVGVGVAIAIWFGLKG